MNVACQADTPFQTEFVGQILECGRQQGGNKGQAAANRQMLDKRFKI